MICEQTMDLSDKKRLEVRPLSDAERARRKREMDQVYGVFPGFRVFDANWVPPNRSWRARLKDLVIYLAAVIFLLPYLLLAIGLGHKLVTGFML